MTTKRATIWEVAALAGVSHQTVSRYLRQDGGMRPATVEKVRAAIEELHFRPSRIARSMRTRRSARIAILLPAANKRLPLRTLLGASTAAHEAGYAIDIVGVEGGEGRLERIIDLADSGDFEGMLALASFGEATAGGTSVPVVTVADYDEEMRGLGAVANGAACGEVVHLLASLGHRHFAHIAGPDDFAAARNRRRTFLGTVESLGGTGIVLPGGWTAEAGYVAVTSLPDETPVTAIVAANDAVATGAIRACHERGWSVPETMSVFGWDDNELCQYMVPALSTVAMDGARLGREAMQRLIAILRDEPAPEPDPTPLHRVIQRESSGPVRTTPRGVTG